MSRPFARRPGGIRSGRPAAPPDRGDDAFELAAAVAREVESGAGPADRLLRTTLRRARWPQPAAGRVARAVFAWFRWRGVLPARPGPAAMRRAVALADAYARRPGDWTAAALARAAVPSWAIEYIGPAGAWLRALQQEPSLWLRARPGAAAALVAELPGAQAAEQAGLPDAVRYGGDEDLFRTPAFAAGRFEIQDVASQAVGVVCGPQPGETWWDACAGEGGKALHLADLMRNRGVVWATDRAPARLAVLRRRAARAGRFNIRVGDWRIEALPRRRRFDGVLLDAPCSGIGTWQRNPHARWTTSLDDVRELAAIQARLLDAAARGVRPGGVLVYAVCTLGPLETTQVADAFDRAHPEFAPLPFPDPFAPGAAPAARAGWVPAATGGNGMFVARWRRQSE